jgi:hypothetical protein
VPQLLVEVEFRDLGSAEAQIPCVPYEVIQVVDEVTGRGVGALSRAWAHADDGEGTDIFIAQLDKVPRLVAKEGDDHVALDAHLVEVLFPQQAAQAVGEAEVSHGAGQQGLQRPVQVRHGPGPGSECGRCPGPRDRRRVVALGDSSAADASWWSVTLDTCATASQRTGPPLLQPVP